MTECLLADGFKSVPVHEDRLRNLQFSLQASGFFGYSMEFGVWTGTSLTFIASKFPDKPFLGFDSFRGLPTPWYRSFDRAKMNHKGDFSLATPPPMPKNVNLVVGRFDETLPLWLQRNEGPVSFIHIDSDLYASAKTVLTHLNDRIEAGTVVVFDELRDWNEQGAYERWGEGEWRALIEWILEADRIIEPLFRTDWIEGTVRVLK